MQVFRNPVAKARLPLLLLALTALTLFIWNVSNGDREEESTPTTKLEMTEERPITPPAPIENKNEPSVLIGHTHIPVEIARTRAEVTKGLSGRPSLDQARGLLFIFPIPDRYRFWMPDMQFSIDIIWIENGKVVHVSEDLPPEDDLVNATYYTPPSPVRYVLEVNAGFARQHSIRKGDPVEFSAIE